jgi:hypothetical protein
MAVQPRYLSNITAYFELTFSTVESRTLTPLILVRIQVPQPGAPFSGPREFAWGGRIRTSVWPKIQQAGGGVTKPADGLRL